VLQGNDDYTTGVDVRNASTAANVDALCYQDMAMMLPTGDGIAASVEVWCCQGMAGMLPARGWLCFKGSW
jgi:hypothetical protein